MPEAAAHEFINRVRANAALRARVSALTGAGTLGRLVAIAHEEGFEFSEDEYRAAVATASEGELSEEALDVLIQEIQP